jgi:Xaa-Pro aminopeptidase
MVKISMYHNRKKIVALRRSMRGSGLDAMLVTSPENRFYLSGFYAEDMGCRESAGALLITGDEQFLLTDGRYVEQAQREAPGWDIVEYRKELPAKLGEIFKELPATRLGYEPACLSCRMLDDIKQHLDMTTLVPNGNKLTSMRTVKTGDEIASIDKAVRAVEKVMDHISGRLEPGMTEREAAWIILEKTYRESDGPSFPPIVASGPNSALPHAVPGARKIEPGDPVIVDTGCRVEGYCSDMTRTFFPGGDPHEKMKEIYRIVREAQSRAQEMIRPGIPCRAVDRRARDKISKAGHGRDFIHSLGHGVGIAVHEAPALSFRNRKHLRSGMVVTVEPGIYLPGKGGVRLENMALVTDDGVRVLNSNRWYHEF